MNSSSATSSKDAYDFRSGKISVRLANGLDRRSFLGRLGQIGLLAAGSLGGGGVLVGEASASHLVHPSQCVNPVPPDSMYCGCYWGTQTWCPSDTCSGGYWVACIRNQCSNSTGTTYSIYRDCCKTGCSCTSTSTRFSCPTNVNRKSCCNTGYCNNTGCDHQNCGGKVVCVASGCMKENCVV